MFLRWLMLATVAALGASVPCRAQEIQSQPGEVARALHEMGRVETPPAVALPGLNKLTELDQAYLDSYTILKQSNSCSTFFGGPSAIEALNELIRAIKPTTLDRRIGFKMEGETMTVVNARTNFQFRMFPKVEVNLNGPFYKKRGMPGQAYIPAVGAYLPGTREARVALLLHELGHLIRKPDGDWLLRDDGKDIARSIANTDVVLDACHEQIRERQRFTFGDELAGVQPRTDVTAEVSKNPVVDEGSTNRLVPTPGRFVPN